MPSVFRNLISPLLAMCSLILCACEAGSPHASYSQTTFHGEQAIRIEEAGFLPIGGIEQWITVRGHSGSPVLLFIHGGPADVQSAFVETYAPYEKDFLLVQWDQRGAGKTFGRYGADTPELSLERVVQDGIELAELLRLRFPDNDLILLGHSWGSVIAAGMVQQRPDLFTAYVGTGQVSSWEQGVNAQFDFLLESALMRGDENTLKELHAIGRPDPLNIPQYFTFTRGLRQQMHSSDRAWFEGLEERFFRSSENTKEDFETAGKGMSFSGQRLIQTVVRTDLRRTAPRFEIPFYVVQGQHDLSTPTAAARTYFDNVIAPKKKMVVIPDAGHFALATHAQQFAEILARLVTSTKTS